MATVSDAATSPHHPKFDRRKSLFGLTLPFEEENVEKSRRISTFGGNPKRVSTFGGCDRRPCVFNTRKSILGNESYNAEKGPSAVVQEEISSPVVTKKVVEVSWSVLTERI